MNLNIFILNDSTSNQTHVEPVDHPGHSHFRHLVYLSLYTTMRASIDGSSKFNHCSYLAEES